MIVDDDTHILTFARHLLSEQGIHVETCDSVVLALDKLKENPNFDLVLCDAKMPRLSGYDLILTLKKDKRYWRIPVAMLSGKKEKEDIRQAIEMGVEDYIIKPIQPEEFLRRVSEILDRHGTGPSSLRHNSFRPHAPVKATATLALEIISLHDKGALLKSPQFLDSDLVLWVGCPFLREIGLHSPQMKVLHSRLMSSSGQEEVWAVHAIFHNLKPEEQQRLEQWLESNANRSKAA